MLNNEDVMGEGERKLGRCDVGESRSQDDVMIHGVCTGRGVAEGIRSV